MQVESVDHFLLGLLWEEGKHTSPTCYMSQTIVGEKLYSIQVTWPIHTDNASGQWSPSDSTIPGATRNSYCPAEWSKTLRPIRGNSAVAGDLFFTGVFLLGEFLKSETKERLQAGREKLGFIRRQCETHFG